MMSLMYEACSNDMREMADDARYAVMLLGSHLHKVGVCRFQKFLQMRY